VSTINFQPREEFKSGQYRLLRSLSQELKDALLLRLRSVIRTSLLTKSWTRPFSAKAKQLAATLFCRAAACKSTLQSKTTRGFFATPELRPFLPGARSFLTRFREQISLPAARYGPASWKLPQRVTRRNPLVAFPLYSLVTSPILQVPLAG
jgi:hypothetical protein